MATLREKEAATALFFCRHGATDYPEDRFYPSAKDGNKPEGEPPLNQEGKEQAQRLGKYFSQIGGVEAIYVSPALRTRQTLEPVARAAETPVVILPDLIERSMGTWDGRSAGEVQKEDPEGWKRWKREPLSFTPPGGESLKDFTDRVRRAVDSIVEKEAGRRIAVFTHVGPIRAVAAIALGIPLENFKRLIVAPGSVTRIDYTKSWPNLVLFGYQP